MRKHATTERSAALACSVALHAGLLAWIVSTHTTDRTMLQQVVDVSVVMLSSPVAEPQEVIQKETPITAEPALSSMAAAYKARPAEKKTAQTRPSLPTTGRQAPEAHATVAALTAPVYNATHLRNTPPAYPDEARRDGIEGNVMLDVSVTELGTAQEVVIHSSSGYRLLDYAARNAVKAWRFIPAHRGEEIVEARVKIPVQFRLE